MLHQQFLSETADCKSKESPGERKGEKKGAEQADPSTEGFQGMESVYELTLLTIFTPVCQFESVLISGLGYTLSVFFKEKSSC